MAEPYYQDESVTLHHGHDLDVLRTFPDGSVDCVVTSPPYFGLRDYGQDGQRGLEPSPAEYVAGLVDVFREIRRVLADDGTAWLNLGDSYYAGRGSPTQPDMKNSARRPADRVLDQPGREWAKPKDLLGIPWRVAFALQDDGWWLRNDIIWTKPNAMPESVADRLSGRHEHVFLLTKSRNYWFDLDAIREPSIRNGEGDHNGGFRGARTLRDTGPGSGSSNPSGRNPGDVWTIPTTPFPGAHFAVFPLALAERCVLAGCRPGGVVLDPYSGSGTTGLAATRHGRRYVGIDLSREYLDLSLRTRLHQSVLEVQP